MNERETATHHVTDGTWDPLGERPFVTKPYRAAIDELRKKFDHFRQYPTRLRRFERSMLGIAGLLLLALVAVGVRFHLVVEMLFIVGMLVGLPWVYYRRWVKGIETDLVHLALAEAQGWHYAPQDDEQRYARLGRRFPDMFRWDSQAEEGAGISVADQLWGAFAVGDQLVRFWSTHWYYVTGSGRSTTEHWDLIVAIQLKKHLKRSLYVSPDEEGELVTNPLTSSDLDLEWNEFNRQFHVHTTPTDRLHQRHAYRVLSPVVMEQFVAFSKQFGRFRASFVDDVFMVAFEDRRLEPTHTRLNRVVELDPRDQAEILDQLTLIAQFAFAVSDYLD